MGVFGKVKKHMILLLADEFLHTDLTLRDLLKTMKKSGTHLNKE